MMVFWGCATPDQNHSISTTGAVVFDRYIPDSHLTTTFVKGGSEQPDFAHLRLEFINLPDSLEGESFTLLGGGLNRTGFHGINATAFEGLGYHFAVLPGEESSNPVRDEAYKRDFVRMVNDGTLKFDVFYHPTDINEWGERYFPGTELALTMMITGTTNRVLHAQNNEFNWAIAGIGTGNSGIISIDF